MTAKPATVYELVDTACANIAKARAIAELLLQRLDGAGDATAMEGLDVLDSILRDIETPMEDALSGLPRVALEPPVGAARPQRTLANRVLRRKTVRR